MRMCTESNIRDLDSILIHKLTSWLNPMRFLSESNCLHCNEICRYYLTIVCLSLAGRRETGPTGESYKGTSRLHTHGRSWVLD